MWPSRLGSTPRIFNCSPSYLSDRSEFVPTVMFFLLLYTYLTYPAVRLGADDCTQCRGVVGGEVGSGEETRRHYH